MSTAYQGRHSGGLHRTPAVGRARPTFLGLSRALRRPLASAAAILAVAAVSAAGSAQNPRPASAARLDASGASFTPSPMAAAQAVELSRNRDDTDAALASARRSGVRRAAVLTHHQVAAAEAAARARAEATRALIRAREAAVRRVARDHAREGILDRARSNPKGVARLLVGDRGWSGQQFGCLDSLWTKESGWRWNADNPGSDAYGIAQALPGSKMASTGADWSTNPTTQITWGLQYISKRYGTPCSAWSHSQAMNWY